MQELKKGKPSGIVGKFLMPRIKGAKKESLLHDLWWEKVLLLAKQSKRRDLKSEGWRRRTRRRGKEGLPGHVLNDKKIKRQLSDENTRQGERGKSGQIASLRRA